MDNLVKKCDNCRYCFKYMKEQDIPLLIKHNPQLENTYNPGQKMCVKLDKFVYKNESCGCHCTW